jgi:hypothetical protein
MMLPSVLMKRTAEKLKESECAEEMVEIINSIKVGKIREAFNKIRKATGSSEGGGHAGGSHIKRCLSSDGNLYHKVQPSVVPMT